MKKLLPALSLFVCTGYVNAQSLVSMSPDTIIQGAAPSISADITGSGTLFQNGSPPNSLIEVTLSNGANTYYGDTWSPVITDDEHATVIIPVGVSPTIGTYDLSVIYWDPNAWATGWQTTVTLPNALVIMPPDGYVQGTVYEDVNQNGLQDGGESGLSGINLTVNPGNITVTTAANGTYSYPLTNGNYTVSYTPAAGNYLFLTSGASQSANFTISNNNSSGNDYPLYRGLNSVYPDSGWLGQNITINVYSDKGIFRPGNMIPLSSSRLVKSSGIAYAFTPVQYTYIDTNHAQVRFNIPVNNVYLGNYNLEIYTNTPYTGKHILKNCFRGVSAPVYISGYVFHDLDSDAVKDINEGYISGQKILLMPDSSFAFSDYYGNYTFGSTAGVKTITWIGGNGYTLQTNNVPSYTQNITTTTSGFKFGVKSPSPDYRCDITYFNGAGRCNVVNNWLLQYKNLGNVPFNGWLYVTRSANVSFVSSTITPTYVTSDTIAWFFTGLQSLETRQLNIQFQMPAAGQQVSLKADMHSVDGSNNVLFTDQAYVSLTVSCSWDPNDKRVFPEGVQAQHYTLMSDTLNYTIRFQNTGNDTAFVVLIRDTIDTNLDLNTFRVLASSHLMNTEVDLETRVAKFTFNNILLPDSNVNEPASHGFINYSIEPKPGLAENTIVYNHADIYFDFNPPVITNETFNTLVTSLAPSPDFASIDNRVCATQSITFDNLTSGNATSYQWSFPGGTPSTSTQVNPTVTYMVKGTYDVSLIASNSTGSNTVTKTAYVLIDSLSVAAVTPGGNNTICKGQSILLSSQSQHPTFTYQWEKNNADIAGATHATYSAVQQATYRVRVTNGLGCTKRSATKTVFTSQPAAPVSANGSTTFCSGGSVQLQTSGSVSNTFQWKKNNMNINGANAPVYNASSHGNYRVLVTDQNGCTNISGVIPVRVNPNPNVTVTASGPLTFCAGQNVRFTVNPQANVTYQWKNNNVNIPGATTHEYTATATGKYRVSALNTLTTCSNNSSIKNVVVNCRIGADSPEAEIASLTVSVYPNPAATSAKIYVEMPADGMLTARMFDMTGRLMSDLLHEQLETGTHEITFNTDNFAAGVYFIKVAAGSEKQTIKFIIEK